MKLQIHALRFVKQKRTCVSHPVVGKSRFFALSARPALLFILLFTLALAFISCVDTPTEPTPDNPYDGRNPDAIPEVVEVNINNNNGFANSTNLTVYITSLVSAEIKLGEVEDQGALLASSWRPVDTVYTLPISNGDGEKWVGCQAKALNGRISDVAYASIMLDTHASIASFTWNATGGDFLVQGDEVTFEMQTADDIFGAEAGGNAVVTMEGRGPIKLIDRGDGSYHRTITITNDYPLVTDAPVTASFVDRAGNHSVPMVAAETITIIGAGFERDFELGETGVMITMVWIPMGEFMMGAQDGEQNAQENEYPRHHVTISEGFWMGKYEVTQVQWEAVVGEWYFFFSGNPNHPAEEVSQNDIHDYFLPVINAAEQGNPWRLPSEAEWEYACRAGFDETRFWWGDDPGYVQLELYAWYVSNSEQSTHNVGTREPNPWGLYDMHGNVREWCEDDWHSDYNNAPDDGRGWVDNPWNYNHVLRGGGWSNISWDCRTANRFASDQIQRRNHNGFRVIRSRN